MSITDELREYAEDWDWLDTGAEKAQDQIEAIADRIDAEHKKAVASVMNDALYHANEKDMAEFGWIRLPKDADGESIHVGDVMEWVRYEDDDPTIVRKVSAVGAGVFFAWSDEQGRYAQYEAHAYRHHHAPTVEDVLREFANEVYADADNEIRDRDFLCAKYAKRLTLTEGEDA